MYTLIDIIESFMDIEAMTRDFYKRIAECETEKLSSFKILAQALSKEENKHFQYYNKLKEEYLKKENIEIRIDAYDKISKMVIAFKNTPREINDNNIHEILDFALNFEKDSLALLLSIQGNLIKEEKDSLSNAYLGLSYIIKEEEKHVRDIEKIIAYKK